MLDSYNIKEEQLWAPLEMGLTLKKLLMLLSQKVSTKCILVVMALTEEFQFYVKK
jgi:hypothetical protein